MLNDRRGSIRTKSLICLDDINLTKYESSSFEMENASKSELSSFEHVPYDEIQSPPVEVARDIPIYVEPENKVPEPESVKPDVEPSQIMSTDELKFDEQKFQTSDEWKTESQMSSSDKPKDHINAHLHLDVSHIIG